MNVERVSKRCFADLLNSRMDKACMASYTFRRFFLSQSVPSATILRLVLELDYTPVTDECACSRFRLIRSWSIQKSPTLRMVNMISNFWPEPTVFSKVTRYCFTALSFLLLHSNTAEKQRPCLQFEHKSLLLPAKHLWPRFLQGFQLRLWL